MGWWALVLLGGAVLWPSGGRAEKAESEHLWMLRQESADGYLRTCSLIRFSEDRDGAGGRLLAGQIDGIGGEYVGDWVGLDPEEDERRRKSRRYMDEIPAGVTSLQVFCALERAGGGEPSGMSCKGAPGAPFEPRTNELTQVTFSAQGEVTRTKFSGRWRNAAGSRTGSFTMELGEGRCSATQEGWVDGAPLWRRPMVTYDAGRRARLRHPATVADVLRALGPGYLPTQSSTGTVSWSFSDGKSLCTRGYPESLKARVYTAC